tara:strand:+ start:5086 stop:5340 length:255 start_codon:yes stop_codon:yes gene_type:complete
LIKEIIEANQRSQVRYMFKFDTQKIVNGAVEKTADKAFQWIQEHYEGDLIEILIDRAIEKLTEDPKWRQMLIEGIMDYVGSKLD